MATTSNESLSELERRAETTRAELAQTVDALQARVSPGAIKADVRSYVRDNPLQAAAIAVGVAYPVWRLVGSIPAPVLLIGAGLAMTRRNGTATGYRGAYGSTGSHASSGGGMMASLKEKASDLGAQIAGKAQETVESVRSMASEKASQASEALSDTYQSSRDAASGTMQQVGEQVSNTYARSRESLADMIDRHPVMVGAAAFAVGSILAAAVPVTRSENRLLGETSEEFMRRTQGLAREGMREASHVAREVYRTAADEVRQEGLTPEAARNTARAAVRTARDAMENATAGGSSRNGNQQF